MQLINNVINNALKSNFIVSSIIVDNLRAQTKGIELFIQTSTNQTIQAIQLIH